MNKDLKATLILMGIVGILFGIWLIGAYASMEVKKIILFTIFGMSFLAFFGAVWKLIRTIID